MAMKNMHETRNSKRVEDLRSLPIPVPREPVSLSRLAMPYSSSSLTFLEVLF